MKGDVLIRQQKRQPPKKLPNMIHILLFIALILWVF